MLAMMTPTRLPRGGSSLPKGPAIPPQLIFRGGIALGVILILIFVIWGVRALVSDPAPANDRAAPITASPAASTEPTVTLIALDTVRVKVVQESNNAELFQGTLVRGQTQTVPKRGAIYITASAGKNLEVEIAGKRYPMPFAEYDRAKIP